MAGELVEIGQVARPHGVRGELRITTFTQSPESFCQFDRIIIRSEKQGERLVEVKQARPHKTAVLLQLAEVRDRRQAENLVGATLLVKREWLPEAEPDEYYWTDLIGLSVFAQDGTHLGRVKNLLPTGAHDILVIDDQTREILIPFLDQFVTDVDLTNKRILVAPPEGLLDV
jgi:16S rRNA processing protein RimM